MTLAQNAIYRSLGNLAVKVQRASDRKKAEALAEGLTEVDQQFQVEISGSVGSAPTWVTVAIAFDNLFVDAPGQRDADLLEPHFTYGAVIEVGPPVWVTAHVREWGTDAQGNFTGASVRIGVWDPDGTEQSAADNRFSGRVHLNFQGYAVPIDPSDEDN